MSASPDSGQLSTTAAAMCAAGTAVLAIGIVAAQSRIAAARRLDRIVALHTVCCAVPLAVFGALHLSGPGFVVDLVPPFMPWRSFWAYFVGCALLAASLSIATGTGVRWSGLLFGIMMYLFVALIHLPGALRDPGRIPWTIVFREMSFGGAGWVLAGCAPDGWRGPAKRSLLQVGRLWIALAMVFFGVGHFLHPRGLPGVPLRMQMPAWVPGRELIDYVTGAALIVAAGSMVLNRRTRTVLSWVGTWLILLLLIIYGPVLFGALSKPDIRDQVTGINYFADTLLFVGVILVVADAAPPLPQP